MAYVPSGPTTYSLDGDGRLWAVPTTHPDGRSIQRLEQISATPITRTGVISGPVVQAYYDAAGKFVRIS
ncbi:uncharacterized protein IL334_003569 [Kwoniella shivajii]|uniref:Uncharacterized protein n=1 Tax=Kwoniella shivajii TaxID=564305 RepID=A0ABZ1CXX8_9TREE|nr:hypothetical protein IL334_003569 [Kwoniella shivajii]